MAINYGGLLGRFIPQANGLSEADRNAIGRQSLLSLGLGLLRPSGGSFGGALANGIQSGLLSANQGVQDAENARYKNEILGRTRQGMERNAAIEAAQQGALNPDGTINQEAWGKWASIDPVGASTFRRENTPKPQNDWTLAQVGDGTPGGLLDVWVNKDTREIRDLQGNPISGGLLAPGAASQSSAAPLGADILPSLEQAVMQVESGGNPAAVSSKGAVGTMQTMPGTLRDPGYGVVPARDQSPAEQERVGKDYLGAMLRQYADPRAALAAYNWGPGNVDNALRAAGGNVDAMLASAPAETRAYVPKVLAQAGGGAGVSRSPQIGSRPAKTQAQSERYRTLSEQEVARLGLPQGTVAQVGPTGQIQIVNKPRDTPVGGAGQIIDNGDGTTTYIPAGKTSEGERNAAGFYQRMVKAREEIDKLTGGGYNPTNARDRFGAAIDDTPLVGGILAPIGRAATSTEGQLYQQAAMNWIRANLRKESGAVIGPKEAADEYKNYFPVVGDTPELIKQKADFRRTLEAAMRSTAGGALPAPEAASGSGDSNIDSLLKKYGAR
ncbi:transglycosylase SLT domain-containing protein [Stenotrophomonas maltophilia]|uniref:lytic transglycosylase domain-containing protein n=1 Tax=Stenotrophomonas maltophilia TaxID=40324 RepID=UPI0039C05D9B